MKAYTLKYTCKIISNKLIPKKIQYTEFFLNKEILIAWLNHKNAHTDYGVYYWSKLNNQFNKASQLRVVPPNSSVIVNKYVRKFIY